MNKGRVKDWTPEEQKLGHRILRDVIAGNKSGFQGGDFSECGRWVVAYGIKHFEHLLYKTREEDVLPKLLKARTPNERRVRAKIEFAKKDISERIDWLDGDKSVELRERFGLLSAVPEWVILPAKLELEQAHINLKGTQRWRRRTRGNARPEQQDPLERLFLLSIANSEKDLSRRPKLTATVDDVLLELGDIGRIDERTKLVGISGTTGTNESDDECVRARDY